jgi:hypothetical protein
MQVRQPHKELHQLEELQGALPHVHISFTCQHATLLLSKAMQVRQLHQLEELQDALPDVHISFTT